ncbi:MAG: TIGR04086 family membrane protein [Bacilli bacterium]|nr:TIGR04086 family membrane protein [Bacilli bacterium]
MKKYLKCVLKITLEILVTTIILTMFSYFDIISNNIYNYLELIIILLILYFNGKKLGNKNNKYPFLEGLKIGILFSLVFMIVNIVFTNTYSTRLLVYYIMVILIPVLGSIRKTNSKIKK